MANVERLKALRDFIRANPDRHDQRMWAAQWPCGTTMCLAGHTVTQAGLDIDWGVVAVTRAEFPLTPSGETNYDADLFDVLTTHRTGDGRLISEAAADYLDLTGYEANQLFFASCNRDALNELDYLIEEYSSL